MEQTWTRDYFAEDDGEMVPRTSHTAAFLSDTKDRGPPVQSQIWRSGEKVPFVQTYSLRAFEKPPQVQTQALRDFEKHLNDLKKENFSLKLRIYFLEERMQQKYEASREDIYKRNTELKVEVESLKRELQDKKQHLDKTWADVENLNSQNEAELRRQFEERQQETEHVYELLENKMQLLQEESRLAKNEAARMAALVEAEKECNLELSEKLKGVTKNWEDVPGDQVKPDQYTEALAQRDNVTSASPALESPLACWVRPGCTAEIKRGQTIQEKPVEIAKCIRIHTGFLRIWPKRKALEPTLKQDF
eukprot:XP_016858516.1 myomegalin isoform X7 [Homo sapiens]